MPLQLIFTSARQGLVPGRSGFCTVARHRAMPERLAQLLESLGTPHEGADEATFTFRILEAAGQHWYVLSRFVARGLDYTQRDNRLAHHLAFSQEEATILPPAAALAYRWAGWKDEWTGDPLWLEDEAKPLALKPAPALTPAASWRQLTGTGAKAAWLVNASGPADCALLNGPETETVLRLFAESAALLGKAGWAATFTTNVTLTGDDGFRWCIGLAPGHAEIDLANAASQPAPTGEHARLAAMGVGPTTAAQPTPTSPKKTRAEKAPDDKGPSVGLILLVSAALLLAGFLGWKVMQAPSPPPPPVVTTPVAPPVDTAKADEIMKANLALKDIDGLIDREEFIDAAKLWFETTALSPDFAARHRTRVVPRLTARFAEVTTRRFIQRLDSLPPGGDGKDAAALVNELQEALRIGTQLETPPDEAWKQLQGIASRAALLASLDVRPTLLVTGAWETGDNGPAGPSQSHFTLSNEAGLRLTKFLESSGVGANNSIAVQLRLLPLVKLHVREPKIRPLMGEIRRGGQGLWVEARAEAGQLNRPIVIGVGPRANTIDLAFRDGEARNFPETNRLIELTLPNGERLALALIANPRALQPLDLGLGGLRQDADTGVVRAAAWAEQAVHAVAWVGGTAGLFPSGHEFPDRDLPSIRATRSSLDTDLIRLESKSGPGTPSSTILTERRRLFIAADLIRAGAPWKLTIVSPRGEELPTLIEFR
jgi:hypothetical protein